MTPRPRPYERAIWLLAQATLALVGLADVGITRWHEWRAK